MYVTERRKLINDIRKCPTLVLVSDDRCVRQQPHTRTMSHVSYMLFWSQNDNYIVFKISQFDYANDNLHMSHTK